LTIKEIVRAAAVEQPAALEPFGSLSKEAIMRRFTSMWLLAAFCCALGAVHTPNACAADQNRLAMFRALTSEQSEGPMLPISDEKSVLVSESTSSDSAASDGGPTLAETQPELDEAAPAPAPIVPVGLANAPVYVQPSAQQLPRRPVNLYGGNSARATLSQLPRRAPVRPGPQRPMRLSSKPFQNVGQDPTLSPYLYLDQEEDDAEDLPNYFTGVRPRFEQQHTNRVQQQEIQQLRNQIQTMITNAGSAPQYEASRSARMGAPARYMNTGQFYSGR
jgi:hypothetical protein